VHKKPTKAEVLEQELDNLLAVFFAAEGGLDEEDG
jgi:hypothetical protein